MQRLTVRARGLALILAILFLALVPAALSFSDATQPRVVLGDDPYEPNDSFAEAYGPLASNAPYEAYIWPDTDQDYFYLNVPAAGLLEVLLENAPTTLQLILYSSTPSTLVTVTTSGGVARIVRTVSPGLFYLRVKPSPDGNENLPYRLRVFIPGVPTATPSSPTTTPSADPFEPNDVFAQAYGPLLSTVAYDGYVWPNNDQDYFYLNVPVSGRLEVLLENAPRIYELSLYTSAPSTLASVTTSGGTTRIVKNVAPGLFYIRVRATPTGSSVSPYRIRVFIPGAVSPTPTPTHTVTAERQSYLPIVVMNHQPGAVTPTATATVGASRTATLTPTPTATRTPTTTATKTPTRTPTPGGSGGTVYITETGTKYHRDGCQYLSESKIPKTCSWVTSHGYTPCGVCKPVCP